MDRLQATAIAGEDITSAVLLDTYTSDGTYELLVNVMLSSLAGEGTYKACLTKQVGGAGAAYQSATTAISLSAGVTTAFLPSLSIPVRSGDVIRVYAEGLAGDAAIDGLVETFDVTAAATGADGDTLKTLSDQMDALPTDADVNAQVDVALADIDLDHFIQVTAGSEEPTDGSYLDQIMHKDGSQTFSAATDSLEALRDALVKSASAGTIDADELTVIRGDTYDSDADNAIEGLGDISTRTKLWIVVKKSLSLTDTQATLYCEETAGITILNGAAYATVAHSVITVTDAVAGDLTWTLDEAVTDDLTPGLYFYDIQTLNAAGTVKTWRRAAHFTVQGDVARVIA